jgi:hydroxymethylglutaryl-CoA lyase
LPGVQYSALIANEKGLNNLSTAKPDAIAIFTAASETFCQKNIHCSIAESFERFLPIIQTAKKMHLFIRGYISCALGCPYEGNVPHDRVTAVANELLRLGCDEIDLGDTVGYGTPQQVKTLIQDVGAAIPITKLAVHFHDTYGQALANIYAALESGITTIDSAVAGLGGCPYAPGAAGNVASEDVVYLLEGLGVDTGIDLEALSLAGKYISDFLGQPTRSKAGAAILSKKVIA